MKYRSKRQRKNIMPEQVSFPIPNNIPVCIGGDVAHNFQPLSEKQVYCTKCAANVKFTKPKNK